MNSMKHAVFFFTCRSPRFVHFAAFVMVGTTVANIAVETSREVANAFLPHHVSLLLSTSFITAISFLTAKKTVETSIAQKEVENVTGPDGSFPE